jgi:TctA family transporter
MTAIFLDLRRTVMRAAMLLSMTALPLIAISGARSGVVDAIGEAYKAPSNVGLVLLVSLQRR